MPLILPNNIVNNEVADAVPIEENYNLIEGYINGQVITRDGANGMAAPLLLVGDPTQPNHAANKEYVDAVMPVGAIFPFGGVSAPAGPWKLCNGQGLSTTAYPDLFALLAFRYGGSGGTFLLPNLKGRFPIGTDAGQAAFSLVGASGGTFTVPVPPHAHPMPHTHLMPHTHEMPHVHSIAHDHPTYEASLANATVQTSVRDNSTPGTTQSFMSASGVGITGLHTDNPAVGGTATVNLPNYTGNSGQPDDATTDASSATSTGAVSTPNVANNTLALTTSGSIATTQVQPYVVVQYIIRVDA